MSPMNRLTRNEFEDLVTKAVSATTETRATFGPDRIESMTHDPALCRVRVSFDPPLDEAGQQALEALNGSQLQLASHSGNVVEWCEIGYIRTG